jgi:catechol-2,3-dioxygenase
MSQPQKPNLAFSHMGVSVRDLDKMECFYTRVLGFTVTDRGKAGGMDIVFLSRDPLEHHQIVLATGRPADIPDNSANAQFGPSINQISFRLPNLPELKALAARLEPSGASSLFPANHGSSWSVYAHDPEGNNLEFFVETEWYIPQPNLVPLDLSKSDEDIYAETKRFCETREGFEAADTWRLRIAKTMNEGMGGGPA